MREITTEKMPIKMWLEDIEEGAMLQIKNIANLPFVYKWVAVMPDSHQGYGMPIGGVVALKSIISPNMVGVDIGCGMCAINTHIEADIITKEQLKEILGKIREVVPVGFKHHQKKQDESLMPNIVMKDNIINREYENARKQLGTLGGGNHFIELQESDEGELWIMIHSGSRNLGKQVCDYYNEKAVEMAEKWYIPNVIEQDLTYFPANSELGKAYIEEMQYCVDFAFANRSLMMDRVQECVKDVLGEYEPEEMINIAHNYASLEHHMGSNVWVHRKGATRAYENEIGIIPGSMGTKSYIVKGKGNVQSFKSCSHGAGRVMSRSQASRELTLEEVEKAMEGIVYGRWGKDRKGRTDFGEAPQAYKDIDIVMENQKDLVEIVTELKPLAVVKG
jgi:tRNA-splicing ligase RtcB